MTIALAIGNQATNGVVRLCRGAVHSIFSNIKYGKITFVDEWGTETFGSSDPDLDCVITVKSPLFYRSLILRTNAGIAAGESFIDQHWVVDSLVNLVRLMIRNNASRSEIDSGPTSRVRALFDRLQRGYSRNSIIGSRRNIAAHYDLGNDFYRVFLDDTLSYSCAYFDNPEMSLRDASIAKIARICDRLHLSSDDHVLEIGAGWGALAIYAARTYGCRVTTTTISEEQFRLATQKVAEAQLSDRVRVVKQDYRDLSGQYDKLVSVEMIEAVGYEFLGDYLRVCNDRVRPGGLIALQVITMPDQEYDEYCTRTDFIQRHIFPASHLPCISELMKRVKESTQLRLVELEEHGLHYARTLHHWRDAFHRRLEEVRALGFDDRFIRRWDFYLAYCEAAFAESYTGCCQLVFQKHVYAPV